MFIKITDIVEDEAGRKTPTNNNNNKQKNHNKTSKTKFESSNTPNL